MGRCDATTAFTQVRVAATTSQPTSRAAAATLTRGSAQLGAAAGAYVTAGHEQCRAFTPGNLNNCPPHSTGRRARLGARRRGEHKRPLQVWREDVGPTSSLRFGAGRPSRFTCLSGVRRFRHAGGTTSPPPPPGALYTARACGAPDYTTTAATATTPDVISLHSTPTHNHCSYLNYLHFTRKLGQTTTRSGGCFARGCVCVHH
jgi:hypothetical protein